MSEAGDRRITRREWIRGALGAGVLAFPTAAGARSVIPDRDTGRDEWLEHALQVERWLRSVRKPVADGVVWPADPLDPESVSWSLYTGTTGVLPFLLELYHATKDPAILSEARAAGDAMLAQLPVAADGADCGLYTGLAGMGFVLAETWRATGDARYRDGARRVVDALHARAARPAGSGGVEWSESSDIISGGAGIALFLLYAADRLEAPGAIELAGRAGQRLLELGQPAAGGLKWAISPRVTNLYPNFSHGAAGVGYALATVFERTRTPALMEGALAAAAYLDAVADRSDGCKVFHHEPGGESLFYLSWCHGGAGTARLWHRLAKVTGDAAWTERIHCSARGITAMGAPEKRSSGYWENISQCCGSAGVGEFFLSAHRLWPEHGYLEVARRAAGDIVARGAAENGGIKWVQAEHRVRPELLVAQTGFMQGAAGVGTFFLRLSAFATGSEPVLRLPDSPFS
ncbi:MAG: hypothetical protein L0271_25435 [Gemmatimonadetes bacterium]|nr:hypothetical protein [Gemmatimonadota bacterium]